MQELKSYKVYLKPFTALFSWASSKMFLALNGTSAKVKRTIEITTSKILIMQQHHSYYYQISYIASPSGKNYQPRWERLGMRRMRMELRSRAYSDGADEYN